MEHHSHHRHCKLGQLYMAPFKYMGVQLIFLKNEINILQWFFFQKMKLKCLEEWVLLPNLPKSIMWAGGGLGDHIRRYLDSFSVTVMIAQVTTFTLLRAKDHSIYFLLVYINNLSFLFLQFFSKLALCSWIFSHFSSQDFSRFLKFYFFRKPPYNSIEDEIVLLD